MAMSVYAGTTLSEAQKIVEGDYAAFDWRERVTYRKVYLGMNPAIRDAENALDNDEDKPAVVALLLKSEKMLVKNRVRRLSAIKTARIILRTRNFSNGQGISLIARNWLGFPKVS